MERTFRSSSHQILDATGKATPIMEAMTADTISVTVTTAKNTTAYQDGAVITVYSDEDMFYKCGNSDVEATTDDFFMKGGIPKDIPLGKGNTHIALIRSTADSTAYITVYK